MKVFVTRNKDSFPSEAMDLLERSCQVTYWKDNSVISKDQLIGITAQHTIHKAEIITYLHILLNVIESIKDSDGLLCLLTDKIDKDVVNAAPNLKVVATMSVGFDHLGKS